MATNMWTTEPPAPACGKQAGANDRELPDTSDLEQGHCVGDDDQGHSTKATHEPIDVPLHLLLLSPACLIEEDRLVGLLVDDERSRLVVGVELVLVVPNADAKLAVAIVVDVLLVGDGLGDRALHFPAV